MIPIYKPDITNYSNYAIDAIKSGWISSQGKYVKLLIEKLKNIFNIPYVVLNTNGTTATHCLFLALKFKYPNVKNIYVPNNVYVAAWNAALMVYKDENIEVLDINEQTWNINTDDEYIMSLKSNSVILIVHNIGNIINIPRLKELRPDIIFVEDNCEGLFGKYNDIYSGMGECSLASSCSFFANKNITSGEGGAFFTHHKDVYDYIFSICHQGMSEKRYIHNVLAYNYRMTNIEAAFVLEQLENIDIILKKKQTIFENFDNLLKNEFNSGKILKQVYEKNTVSANWMYAIRIYNNKSYDTLFNFLYSHGIDNRPLFYPINVHSHLLNIKTSEDKMPFILNEQCVMLPSYPDLTYEEQQHIADIIKKFLE